MAESLVFRDSRSFGVTVGRILEQFYTFVFSGLLTLALAANTYSDSLEIARLSVVLSLMLLVEGIAFRRLLLGRELGLYAWFFLYMLIELPWTPEISLAGNTLVPALNFMLVLVLFGTLAACHSVKTVLSGSLCGLVGGALLFTLTQGFPFYYPPDFSYNAIAGMYLFGLILAVMLSCYSRLRLLLVPLQLLLLLLIIATTSIKTNLGIVLGVAATCFVYFRRFFGVLRHNFLALTILVAAVVFAIMSNDDLQKVLERGVTRVSIGLSVLQSREDQPGYTAFQYRTIWEREGLSGWLENPVFGYGVEAFRYEFGITSHSTPIDLLYNSGLIGVTLFYGTFGSLAQRLWRVRGVNTGSMGAVIFGTLVCYAFITLSAAMYTNTYLAAFFGLSSQILRRYCDGALREPSQA